MYHNGAGRNASSTGSEITWINMIGIGTETAVRLFEAAERNKDLKR